MTGCGILLQFLLDVASQSSCCGWSFLLAFCVGEQLIAFLFFHSCLQSPRFVDPLHLSAMACPALPLCPLAIAEAEQGAPDILQRIRDMFERVSFVCHPLGSLSRNMDR